jgi:hypothetical protein
MGRVATEEDVAQGKAVFYVRGASEPYQMEIPCLGSQFKPDGSVIEVVVIQAEVGPNGPLLGIRYFEGGNGVCTLGELRLGESTTK